MYDDEKPVVCNDRLVIPTQGMTDICNWSFIVPAAEKGKLKLIQQLLLKFWGAVKAPVKVTNI